MPYHHSQEDYPVGYLDGARLRSNPKGPLFRTIGRGTGQLTRTVLRQANAYTIIRRRAAAAGIETKLGNHKKRVSAPSPATATSAGTTDLSVGAEISAVRRARYVAGRSISTAARLFAVRRVVK